MYGKKSPTFYCSQVCQRMHWTVHKLECKVAIDRKELYKIGSLLQWAFYAERKVMWQDDVGRVKKIEQTSEDNKPKLLVWRDKAKISSRLAFPAFPDSLFDEERDKHAVLAHEAPGVSLMSGLMGQLLKGAYQSIMLFLCNRTDMFSLQIQDRDTRSGHPPKSLPLHKIRLSHRCLGEREVPQLAFPCDAGRWFGVCGRRL